jgi:hypothetical protein
MRLHTAAGARKYLTTGERDVFLRQAALAVPAGIPLNLVQKWLSRAQLSTTAVYADAVGAQERDIARRTWDSD